MSNLPKLKKELYDNCLFYLNEVNRRKTFKSWVFDISEPCNADKMAEAGFVFMGNKDEPDVVKCFMCHKSLDGWESKDDPWQEHLKHSKNCQFAKLQKAQGLLKVDEFLNLRHECFTFCINRYCDQLIDQVNEKFRKVSRKI